MNAAREIARLNDALSCSLLGGEKTLLITAGVAALPSSDRAAILAKVIGFDTFNKEVTRMAGMTLARSIMRVSAFGGRSTLTIRPSGTPRRTLPILQRRFERSPSCCRMSINSA